MCVCARMCVCAYTTVASLWSLICMFNPKVGPPKQDEDFEYFEVQTETQ